MTSPERYRFEDAAAYERFMGRWSKLLAERFLDFAGLSDGERVLDVGCGTGNLSLAIIERGPSVSVAGIDPSRPFVELTRQRVPKGRFEVGDAQALPFEPESFDRTLCQLVLNFIPDCSRAVAEMRRVTKPGGTVAAALWDLSGGRMRMLDDFWEAVGGLSERSRWQEHATARTAEELVAMWHEAGLTGVDSSGLTISTGFRSFDDYWSPFLLGVGPAGACAVSLSPPEQAQVRERLRARVLGSRPDGPFALEARAFAVRGTVP